MKFTELHIAVVTFHPPGIYFLLSRPVVRIFRGSYERTETEREKKKREKREEKIKGERT